MKNEEKKWYGMEEHDLELLTKIKRGKN